MDHKPRTRKLPRHVVIRVAGAAGADPRTVAKFCDGQDVRAMGAERIEKALKAEGIVVSSAEGESR